MDGLVVGTPIILWPKGRKKSRVLGISAQISWSWEKKGWLNLAFEHSHLMVVKYYLCKFLYSHFLLFVENRVPTDMTAWGSLLPGKPHLGGEKGSGNFLVSFSLLTCGQASDALTVPGSVSTAPNQALGTKPGSTIATRSCQAQTCVVQRLPCLG